MERWIRLIAGSMVLLSVVLTHWVSPYWVWLTVFVGVNLAQSALTKWCLMENILGAVGVPACQHAQPPQRAAA
jgi:hypothetical protein